MERYILERTLKRIKTSWDDINKDTQNLLLGRDFFWSNFLFSHKFWFGLTMLSVQFVAAA